MELFKFHFILILFFTGSYLYGREELNIYINPYSSGRKFSVNIDYEREVKNLRIFFVEKEYFLNDSSVIYRRIGFNGKIEELEYDDFFKYLINKMKFQENPKNSDSKAIGFSFKQFSFPDGKSKDRVFYDIYASEKVNIVSYIEDFLARKRKSNPELFYAYDLESVFTPPGGFAPPAKNPK